MEGRYSVCVRALDRLRIARLARDRDLSFDVLPEICFMQIGKNGVLSFSVEVIVRNILALASYIHSGLGVTRVVIGQPIVGIIAPFQKTYQCYKRSTAGIIDGGHSFLSA